MYTVDGYSKLVSQDALNNTKGIKSPKLRKQWTMAKITFWIISLMSESCPLRMMKTANG